MVIAFLNFSSVFVQIILNSMHKYQPRVHLVKKKEHCGDATVSAAATAAFSEQRELRTLDAKQCRTFVFPETVFIGVTAYQNQLVSAPLALGTNILPLC